MLDHHRFPSIFAHLVPVLLLPLIAACGESAGAPAAVHPIKPVMAAPIAFADGQDRRTFSAQIKPRVEGSHGFRVSGRVVRRFVDVGALVKAGDPLAALDDADFHLQLDQAEAEERAARNVLSHEEAEQSRFATLRDKGFTAAAAFERQRATADEARSRLMRAERAVGLARNALRYATLIAQDDGVVTAVRVEPGQVVDVGAPAFIIAKSGGVEAEVAVPEALVEFARTGVATVSLWSAGSKTYAARLRELAPLADPTTRTFMARYTIAAPDEIGPPRPVRHSHPFRLAPAPRPCSPVGDTRSGHRSRRLEGRPRRRHPDAAACRHRQIRGPDGAPQRRRFGR